MTGAICLAAGLLAVPLGEAITLRWTHSIEKIAWEEDYRLQAGALHLTEARIRGSGAGMEPPPGARLADGVWHYRPELPALPKVSLRHSPHAPSYTVCARGRCQPVGQWLPALPAEAILELRPCRY